MLLDQFATLITQLIAFYIPIDDMSIKITCSVAITGIVYAILKFIYDRAEKFFKKKISYNENYVIIDRDTKFYIDFIKYLYDKYGSETKGCKIKDHDGIFKMLIDELNDGELYDDYKNNKITIMFEQGENNNEKNENKKNLSGKNIVVKTNGNIKILDDYIKSIIRDINTSQNKDINMYKLKVYGSKKDKKTIEWIKNKFVTNKTMQNTIVVDEVQKLYYDDITKFISNKDYYFKKGIPYKRGYLLHGEPGCGKTSLIKAVAHDLNLPIFMVDLSVLSDNSELMSAMNELNYHINDNEPYLLIFEDLDRTTVFGKLDSRDYDYDYNKPKLKTKITQDCILNILDGIDENHGRITIITTNDLDRIKKFKSLIRPGRIDIAIKVTYCTSDQLKRIIKFYFDVDDISKYKIKDNIVITPAQLLQILYLLNDVNKVITLLNKFIDFTSLDIEKEIFNIKFIEQKPKTDPNDPNQTDLDIDEMDDAMGNMQGKKKKSFKKKSSFSRSKRSSNRSNYKNNRLQRSITNVNNRILGNQKTIDKLELSMDKRTDLIKLDIEARKLRLKMDELRKDKLNAMMENTNKQTKPSTKKIKMKNDVENANPISPVFVGFDCENKFDELSNLEESNLSDEPSKKNDPSEPNLLDESSKQGNSSEPNLSDESNKQGNSSEPNLSDEPSEQDDLNEPNQLNEINKQDE